MHFFFSIRPTLINLSSEYNTVCSFSPIFPAIVLSVFPPDAICSTMLFTTDTSANSCVSKFLVSSYKYPSVWKKKSYNIFIHALCRIDHWQILCNASGNSITNCFILIRIVRNKFCWIQIIKRFQFHLRITSSKQWTFFTQHFLLHETEWRTA